MGTLLEQIDGRKPASAASVRRPGPTALSTLDHQPHDCSRCPELPAQSTCYRRLEYQRNDETKSPQLQQPANLALALWLTMQVALGDVIHWSTSINSVQCQWRQWTRRSGPGEF
jgi:hypothetical protein